MENLKTVLSEFTSENNFISLKGEVDPLFIGLEIEAIHTPSSVKHRQLQLAVGEKRKIRDVIRALLHDTRDFYIQEVVSDHRKDELVFKPISLLAHEQLLPEYQILLDLMVMLGYQFESSYFEEIGIHHNLDKILSTNEFSFFLDTIYEHRFELLSVSNRRDYSTRNSDIQWMLGDQTGFLPPTKLLSNFHKEKAALLHAYSNNQEYRALGIHLKPDNLIELSWWGSSHDSRIIWRQIKFVAITINQIQKNQRPLIKTEINKIIELIGLDIQVSLLPHNIKELPSTFGSFLKKL